MASVAGHERSAMHTIDSENYLETREAIRDILMMYFEMTNYNGFGHGVSDEIRFEAKVS